MNDFSVWEILMLLCFACSWPVSIIKTLRTKMVLGKSPLFMSIILLGYIFGMINKIANDYDIVTYLYAFNFLIVLCDLLLYFHYIKQNKVDLLKQQTNNLK
jgi:type III secretory pathway component EscT